MKRRSFRDYSYINKFFMNACGVLPRKSQNDPSSVFISFVTVGSLCFLGGACCYELILHWDSIEVSERFEQLVIGQFFITCVIKAFILLAKRKKHYALMENCTRLWRHVKSQRDLEIVEQYTNGMLHFMYIYISCICSSMAYVLIAPTFTSIALHSNDTILTEKLLPWTVARFSDLGMEFYIWYALQVQTTIGSLVAIVALNTAPFFYVLHAGIHMRLCQHFFESVTEKMGFKNMFTESNVNWSTRRNKFFQHVVQGIAYHSEVLQYSKDVKEVFESVVFAEMCTALTTAGGCCFLCQVVPKQYLPRIASGILAMIMQMLILCWPPDSLQEESLRVAHAAYSLRWYDWTGKEGKLIYIIITKSHQPVVITAKKMIAISLQTFVWLLKSTFSMFTLLRHVIR